MPLLPQGVYERVLDRERTEVAFFGDELPGAGARRARGGGAARPRRGGGAGLAPRSGGAAPAGRGRSARCASARPTTRPPPTGAARGDHRAGGGRVRDRARIRPRAGASSCCSARARRRARGPGLRRGRGRDRRRAAGVGAGVRPRRRRARRSARPSATRSATASRSAAVLADLREIPPPPAPTLVGNMPLDVPRARRGALSPATRARDRRVTASAGARRRRGLRHGRARAPRAGRERDGPRCGWSGRDVRLLDPGPRGRRGRAHGQLASAMPGGGLRAQLPQARRGRARARRSCSCRACSASTCGRSRTRCRCRPGRCTPVPPRWELDRRHRRRGRPDEPYRLEWRGRRPARARARSAAAWPSP